MAPQVALSGNEHQHIQDQHRPCGREALKHEGEIAFVHGQSLHCVRVAAHRIDYKMMRGLSTRNYGAVVKEFSEAYGIEKSAVRK
ncbi:MAG TPA: hypothetical protein VN442_04745 [Bryobacteraceae bacterium]|nr:hypothetical protein [Bryobacteraceae bacterium]